MTWIRLAGAALSLSLLNLPEIALAQVNAFATPGGCIAFMGAETEIDARGLLASHVFPGRPNDASVAAGDAPEKAFILALDHAVCADDGGAFADPTLRFDTIHVYATEPELRRRLEALDGHAVRVVGQAFVAHTGHHHAPVVLTVQAIIGIP